MSVDRMFDMEGSGWKEALRSTGCHAWDDNHTYFFILGLWDDNHTFPYVLLHTGAMSQHTSYVVPPCGVVEGALRFSPTPQFLC